MNSSKLKIGSAISSIFRKIFFTKIELITLIITSILWIPTLAQETNVPISFSENERNWINENPVIIASSNEAYAPIDFVSAGIPTGISIDILTLLGRKTGLEIRYAPHQPLNENLKLLSTKQINLVHSISSNEERSQLFNFSAPYLNDSVVNFGRVGSPQITSMEDLQNKRIAVIKGTVLFDAYTRNHPSIELVELKDIPEALRAISNGTADVFTAGEFVTNYLIQQTSLDNVEIIGNDYVLENQTSFGHRIATHKDDVVLQSILDKGLAAITDDEFNAILEKWMGQDYFSDIGLTDEEKLWLSRNPVIRVGVNPTLAPIEFINPSGEIDGIVSAYLEKFSERLGVEFVWAQNESWNDAFTMIRNGEIELLSNLTPTAEREEFLTFTDSFMSTSLVIFAQEGSQFFGNMAGLTGGKIAQVRGFSTLEFIRRDYPEIEIIEVSSIIEALELVSSGNADAYIGTIPATSYYIASEGITNIVISGETPYNGRNSMGIRSDLPLLASSMQKAMNSISLMERTAISRDWLSLTIENRIDYTILWYIVGVFVLIGGTILYWNRKLVVAQKEAMRARKDAEAANEAKSRFLASMSHDLRTPLNAIIGFSEVIGDELHGPLHNDRYKEYTQDIHSSGKYLLKLVNDILDVSKLEAGEKSIEPSNFDFAEFAEECSNLVRKLAEDKNITCSLNIEEQQSNIYADEQALMQIMINILSNAIKFTPRGGKIEVHGHSSNDNYHISISDNGEGIAEEKIGRITEPFIRANDSAHVANNEGTGLGLSIVKALVDLHQGSLEINSQIGQGTIVTISLPNNMAA